MSQITAKSVQGKNLNLLHFNHVQPPGAHDFIEVPVTLR